MVEQFYAAEALKDQPMHPQTSETFGEYFGRFRARMEQDAAIKEATNGNR